MSIFSWRPARGVALLLVGLALSGCVKTFHLAEGFEHKSDTTRVLVMPSDVELSVLTASGILEPRADWTETGKKNVAAALDKALAEKKASLQRFGNGITGDSATADDIQLIKLHKAVGASILLHKYVEPLKLPTKGETFDWTLGRDAAALRERYDADYALFVYMRDSFASGGRAAVILVGAILGVGVPGGRQEGFASLVDLRTGEIVWFNLRAAGSGDLREPASAADAVKGLLNGFPL